jgi:GNAT superfamily N-acetyltransferase
MESVFGELNKYFQRLDTVQPINLRLYVSSRLLQQLFVLPSCQKRRVGTRLIEDGLRMIESTEQAKQVQDSFGKHKIGLTSSPQGQVLYERYGFKSVYWFNPHFRDKNEQGGWIERSARWPLMLKSNSV